jgi:hypothetical protein
LPENPAARCFLKNHKTCSIAFRFSRKSVEFAAKWRQIPLVLYRNCSRSCGVSKEPVQYLVKSWAREAGRKIAYAILLLAHASWLVANLRSANSLAARRQPVVIKTRTARNALCMVADLQA